MLMVLLFGCGGGSGSSSGFSQNANSEDVHYSGNQNQAILTLENSQLMLEEAYSGWIINYNYGSTLSSSVLSQTDRRMQTNRFHVIEYLLNSTSELSQNIIKNQGQALAATSTAAVVSKPIYQSGECGGSYSGTYNEDTTTGDFNGTITYSNYCSNGAISNGRKDFTGTYNPQTGATTSMSITLLHYSITVGGQTIRMSGTLSQVLSGTDAVTVNMNICMEDGETGKVFWFEDYKIDVVDNSNNQQLTISGTFYDPDFGYVGVSTEKPIITYTGDTDPRDGTFVITGTPGIIGGNAKARLTFLTPASYQEDADINGDGIFDDWSTGIQVWPDTYGLVVISTSPQANARGVSPSTMISATFNNTINPQANSSTLITVSPGSSCYSIAGSVKCNGSTITFTPSSPLSEGVAYTVRLSASITDVNGRYLGTSYSWTFLVGDTPDITPPQIVSVYPANGATEVPLNVVPTLTFSEDIDPASLVYTISSQPSVSMATYWNKPTYAGSVIYFTPYPSYPLLLGCTYTITITGAKDYAGNSLTSTYIWSFTIEEYTGPAGLWQPADGSTPITGNYVYLDSESGDYIGRGQTYTYTQANAQITLNATGGHLTININGYESWTGNFQVPSNISQLQPGVYDKASFWPHQNSDQSGLDWSGNGRWNNSITGWFVVDNVTYTNGVLMAIDLRFEQHSNHTAPALHGKIHWVYGDTTSPPGPIVPPPAGLWKPAIGSTPILINYVYLKSDPGDYVGGGLTYTYTPINAKITVKASGDHLSVSIKTNNGDLLHGDFLTMNTLSQLQVGYYGNLKCSPYYSNPTVGGLNWSVNGRDCNAITGWFVVDDVTYTEGVLTAIDLRFEQVCGGATSALHGQIHWRQ